MRPAAGEFDTPAMEETLQKVAAMNLGVKIGTIVNVVVSVRTM